VEFIVQTNKEKEGTNKRSTGKKGKEGIERRTLEEGCWESIWGGLGSV